VKFRDYTQTCHQTTEEYLEALRVLQYFNDIPQ